MNKPITTAIASFGMSGQVFHGPSLKVHPGFQVTKIWERSKSLSTKLFPEATILRTWEEILRDDNIELVIVNTPDHLHYEMARQALESDKHVVVEKPFTKTSAEAQELIDLARSKNLLLTVYHNRRLDGGFRTVKKILEQKMLGRLVEFESHFDRYRNYIQQSTWKEEGDDKTGVLYNLGSHMVDQSLTLFGNPKAVTAHLGTNRTDGKIIDYYDIRLHYDGFNALLKSSYLVREPGPCYILHGTEGSYLKWGVDTQEEMLKEGFLPQGPEWGKEPEENWGIMNTTVNGLHYKGQIETEAGNYADFYADLYGALRENKEPMVKSEEAMKVIEILEQCIESHRQGKTIYF